MLNTRPLTCCDSCENYVETILMSHREDGSDIIECPICAESEPVIPFFACCKCGRPCTREEDAGAEICPVCDELSFAHPECTF